MTRAELNVLGNEVARALVECIGRNLSDSDREQRYATRIVAALVQAATDERTVVCTYCRDTIAEYTSLGNDVTDEVRLAAYRAVDTHERTCAQNPYLGAVQFAEEVADLDCYYRDNCPDFGTRHGVCNPCKAKRALAAARAWLERDKDAVIAALRTQCDIMRSALAGVIRVADRKTVEFDAARAALAAPPM